MLKEIAEQPAAVADTLLGHFVDGRIVLDEQRLADQELRDVDKVFVVACGTAYHSGLMAKYAIEHWTRMPVEVEMASEFRYRDPVLDRHTLVVAISQSGETADTLEAVRHATEQRAKVLAICNTNGARSRANPTRCSTPTPVPRSALRRPRPSWPRSPPSPGRAGACPGPRHEVRRRDRPRVRRAGGDADWSRGCWRSSNRCRAGPGSPSRRRCCSSVATSATRWRWRAR